MTRISGHPSDDTLEKSLLGHLSDCEMDDLADHVANCFPCVRRLDEARNQGSGPDRVLQSKEEFPNQHQKSDHRSYVQNQLLQ